MRGELYYFLSNFPLLLILKNKRSKTLNMKWVGSRVQYEADASMTAVQMLSLTNVDSLLITVLVLIHYNYEVTLVTMNNSMDMKVSISIQDKKPDCGSVLLMMT